MKIEIVMNLDERCKITKEEFEAMVKLQKHLNKTYEYMLNLKKKKGGVKNE